MALKSFEEFGNIAQQLADNSIRIYQGNMAAKIMQEVAHFTPVDRGYAKGNWEVDVNDDTVKPSNDRDRTKTGIRAKRKALKKLQSFMKNGGVNPSQSSKSAGSDDAIYIKNGVVGIARKDGKYKESEGKGYIIQLDEGKSEQSPFGMVYPTLARIDHLSKQALRGK